MSRSHVLSLLLLVGSTMLLPAVALAQGGGFPNPLDNISSFPQLFARILEIVAMIAVPFVVLAIVYTGFLFVTARGNTDKLAEAKQAFFWTVVGALLILGASILAEAIGGTVEELQGTASHETELHSRV